MLGWFGWEHCNGVAAVSAGGWALHSLTPPFLCKTKSANISKSHGFQALCVLGLSHLFCVFVALNFAHKWQLPPPPLVVLLLLHCSSYRNQDW
jgi:hypothetical protein